MDAWKKKKKYGQCVWCICIHSIAYCTYCNIMKVCTFPLSLSHFMSFAVSDEEWARKKNDLIEWRHWKVTKWEERKKINAPNNQILDFILFLFLCSLVYRIRWNRVHEVCKCKLFFFRLKNKMSKWLYCNGHFSMYASSACESIILILNE